jgi:hypothetical protein
MRTFYHDPPWLTTDHIPDENEVAALVIHCRCGHNTAVFRFGDPYSEENPAKCGSCGKDLTAQAIAAVEKWEADDAR